MLVVASTACGVRTTPGEFEDPFEGTSTGGGEFGAEAGAYGVEGRRRAQPPTGGIGGSRAGGIGAVTSTGGTGAVSVSSGGGPIPTGGAAGVAGAGPGGAPPVLSDDFERLAPFLCLNSCSDSDPCPSPSPYVGGCNQFFHGCTITCEAGCPPELEPEEVNGGCFCYSSAFSMGPDGCCSNDRCGAPYFLPCCSGRCSNGRCL